MTIPHELGHALAARFWGYEQIRMLVGFGRTFFSMRVFGFPCVFGRIPVGGLTLFKPPERLHRWKHLTVLCGGLLVNLAVAAVTWLLIPSGSLLEGGPTIIKILFWGNLLVVAENLIPQMVQTQLGACPTDGFQLWYLLFKWKRPWVENEKVPVWEVIICHALKWSILLIVTGATVLMAFLSVRMVIKPLAAEGWGFRTILIFGCAFLAALGSWAAFRVFVNPIATTRKPLPFGFP